LSSQDYADAFSDAAAGSARSEQPARFDRQAFGKSRRTFRPECCRQMVGLHRAGNSRRSSGPEPDSAGQPQAAAVAGDTSTVRVVLSGDLDLVSANAPMELAHGLMADREVSRVIVDLAAVRFVDSSGLGGLVQLSNYARSRGADVVLSGASARVRAVLALAGLAAVLPLETAETEPGHDAGTRRN
jgi:anti-anti-sigma factor